MSAFPHRHLLGIEPLAAAEIQLVLDTAESLKEVLERPIKKVPTLRGKTVVNFFVEASTRTRTSFEIAAKRLSADAINISASASSLVKGETLLDTARNLQAMRPDAIVIRHSSSGAPHQLARLISTPIVNAGDGAHEHPTQALLDALTIRDRKKSFPGLKVAIVGDLLHSRVARSNIHLLTKLGAEVWATGPQTLLPPHFQDIVPAGLTVTPRMDDAIRDADVIIVLRIQRERQEQNFFPSLKEYAIQFGINARRLALAKPDVIVLHPGPINRGIEISSEVADGPYSVILDQVTNGVAVRMAILYLLIEQPS